MVLEKIIAQVENYRSIYRSKHKDLESLLGDSYHEKFDPAYQRKLSVIKNFLKEAKEAKRCLRGVDEKENKSNRMIKLQFLNEEINRTISTLENAFSKELTSMSDDEIMKKKRELNEQNKVLQTVPKTIEILIDSRDAESTINEIRRRYDNLIMLKTTYSQKLEDEVSHREIEKHKEFNMSSINIKLGKFKGYESCLDIYTFKDEFDKLYLRSTPKSLLPEILKNNLLEGSALALVKNVKDVDDIWTRLINAYGDSRLMLSKKLAELNNIDQLWKSRDSSKTADGISKIINLMKDLLQLAQRHSLEYRLFYGDSLEKIYKLIGEGRLTRWLQLGCKKDGQELWLEFMRYLESELKVSQQKILIFGKAPEPPVKDKRHGNYHVENDNSSSELKLHEQNSSLNCTFCGESNHVRTNGPGGTKIVQYFACQKFAEMSPMDRFKTLKEKRCCYQCLFPGADMSRGKHKDGKCQYDFVCKHISHDKFTRKKHFLVCEEHKDTKDNQDLLKLYKSRFITNQRHQDQLPDFARERHPVNSKINTLKSTRLYRKILIWTIVCLSLIHISEPTRP